MIYFDQKVPAYYHAAMSVRRCRMAANSSAAIISSRVNSGKSLRISSKDMPDASHLSTSSTVIRMPLIHGLPLLLPGSIVIIFLYINMMSKYLNCHKNSHFSTTHSSLRRNKSATERGRRSLSQKNPSSFFPSPPDCSTGENWPLGSV